MYKLLKKAGVLFLAVLLMAFAFGCTSAEPEGNAGENTEKDTELILATTTSTYDTGLLDEIVPVFEEKTGYKVSILSKGTGAALELGKNGDCDVLLVHAKEKELALVEEGFFVDRYDVMYNDFVILGSEEDPAQISGMNDVVEAFKKIAETESEFCSRGDESGTHVKEMEIWEKADIKEMGDWYNSLGQGMGDTLRVSDEKGAYTLSDRGTYLSMKDKLKLQVVVEGDPLLFNQYGVMAVNKEKHENVNYEGAKAFIDFLISEEGQKLIGEFKKYGEQLFVPNAE